MSRPSSIHHTSGYSSRNTWTGIGLALITVMIWSGNYVVARAVSKQIPPVSLAFYRWSTATLFILPFAWKNLKHDVRIAAQNKAYIFFTAFMGITVFNTLIYLAGHYSPAINLALLGTTMAPIFAILLAAIFLNERITGLRITGMAICFAGVLVLLSRGDWESLKSFRIQPGDLLILGSAFSFAIYNTLVKRRPGAISATGFLFILFLTGTAMLFIGWLIERRYYPPVNWTGPRIATIIYLGIGNSAIGFLCWNLAIARLGAARTALFANLIPLFSSVEAVIFLQEQFRAYHLLAGILIVTGLVIANLLRRNRAG